MLSLVDDFGEGIPSATDPDHPDLQIRGAHHLIAYPRQDHLLKLGGGFCWPSHLGGGLAIVGPVQRKGPRNVPRLLTPLAYIRPNDRYPPLGMHFLDRLRPAELNEGGLGPIVAGGLRSAASWTQGRLSRRSFIFLVGTTGDDPESIIRQGLWIALASCHGACIQTSRSSSVVRITGIAFVMWPGGAVRPRPRSFAPVGQPDA
jgi:hypothetical protein